MRYPSLGDSAIQNHVPKVVAQQGQPEQAHQDERDHQLEQGELLQYLSLHERPLDHVVAWLAGARRGMEATTIKQRAKVVQHGWAAA